MDSKSINSVFRVLVDPEGNVHHRLAGKFLLHGGEIHVLEDHDGFLDGVQDGPVVPGVERLLRALRNSMHTKVVNHQDWVEGKHPELLPGADEDPEPTPEPRLNEGGGIPRTNGRTSRFSLQVRGSKEQMHLFVRGNVVLLNDQPLEPEQVQVIRNALENGDAILRYLPEEKEMQKMEELTKAIDPALATALGHMRAAVKAGHMPPEALKSISNEMFKDSMVPTLGNKKAYKDFLSRPREGVHIAADANGFKSINDTFGHHVGDQAIKALGGAFREALDESVGRKNAKAFRTGGDEFVAHVPSHEHAARFARVLRQKLDGLAPVGGTHKYSMSLGFGHTPEHADKALYHAKDAKVAAKYPAGQAQMHVHSLVPGSEGPVPVSPTDIGLKAPPPLAPPPLKP
jgi:diguanylate cyclase (GGDEF)-like protein